MTDHEPEPIALRIVVDGASTAGKTTTARSLGERLGRPVTTPEEDQGRTLLFDWLDHTGGRSDGRAIRTQVVAVPGHLPHLRVQLLVTADVVLFVADTTEAGIDATVSALAQVRELLAAISQPAPGLLIQANKRDCVDALPMDEVRRRLGLADDQLVIESVATDGDGVRQAFVYAVRLGLQRIRASDGERVAEFQSTAEELLAALDEDLQPDPVPADPQPEAAPVPEQEPVAGAPSSVEPELDPVPEPVREPEPEPVPAPAAVREESPLAAISAARRGAEPPAAAPARKPPPPPWRRWLSR